MTRARLNSPTATSKGGSGNGRIGGRGVPEPIQKSHPKASSHNHRVVGKSSGEKARGERENDGRGRAKKEGVRSAGHSELEGYRDDRATMQEGGGGGRVVLGHRIISDTGGRTRA